MVLARGRNGTKWDVQPGQTPFEMSVNCTEKNILWNQGCALNQWRPFSFLASLGPMVAGLSSIIGRLFFPAACSAAAGSCSPAAASCSSPLAPRPPAAARCRRRSPAGCGRWSAWKRWSIAGPPWRQAHRRRADETETEESEVQFEQSL